MRLQLIAIAGALLIARGAHADPVAASARVSVYEDSDHTSVVTSSVAASGDATEHVRLGAQYLADAVSSASIDVVSAASKRIHDVRSEGTFTAAYHADATTLGASYVYSTEHDWDSHNVALALSRDFLARNLTVGITPALATNAIRDAGDPRVHERLRSAGGEVYATYTLSPRDLVLVGAGVTFLDGFQASPYRFVVVGDRRAYAEVVPDTRVRAQLTLRWNRHLFDDTALRTRARAYRDDWGVLSATADAEYVVGLGDLELGAHLRGYAQRGARFYRPRYDELQTYLTSDRELSTFVDVFGGGSIAYRRELDGDRSVRVDLGADAFDFWFRDVPRLPTRTGVVVSLGVALAL